METDSDGDGNGYGGWRQMMIDRLHRRPERWKQTVMETEMGTEAGGR